MSYAMRGPELPVLIVGIVFTFVYLIVRVTTRERLQRRRIELVEHALQNGAIDEITKRELVAAVTDTPRRQGESAPWLYRLGWFGLFAGGAMLLTGQPKWWRWEHWFPWETSWAFVCALSLGAVTLPFAIRELQTRRHAPAPGHRNE